MTIEKDYILHEPLDATKYRFSVNVVIERTLDEVNSDDPSLPSNSSKLNLETEGDSRSCVAFAWYHIFSVFDRDNIISAYVISKPLPPKLDQVEDSEVAYCLIMFIHLCSKGLSDISPFEVDTTRGW